MSAHILFGSLHGIWVGRVPRGLQDVGVSENVYKLVPPTDERHGGETEPNLEPNVVVPHYR